MKKSIVLTVMSDDRSGIVETLSKVLEDHGGNWVESSMLSLAGKFAGVLLADVPDGQVENLFSELSVLESSGLRIVAERCDKECKPEGTHRFCLELVGQDRPGIVRNITNIMAKHQANIDALETRCEEAAMSGEVLFMTQAHISLQDKAALEALNADLEGLANELMVDIKLAE